MNSKHLARIIGGNLRHIQKERFPGWGGQKKFADFLGISANDLCAYEYARTTPPESRLAVIAERLGMDADALRIPLPGVEIEEPAPSGARGMDDLSREIARLEGRLELMREQSERQEERLEQLQEANYTLRTLLYVDDTPEARERRERLLERLSPSIADLVQRREVF